MGSRKERSMGKTISSNGAGSATILIVEDSHTQALHLQALLKQKGLEATLAFDGESGLQMARQLHPALIILDVQMPEMDGFEVCKRLKKSTDTTATPIIMLTCHDEQEAIRSGLQAGVVDYIPKDAFADAVLIETLKQMGLIVPDAEKESAPE
jgi:CheY-like chemotaxis protein